VLKLHFLDNGHRDHIVHEGDVPEQAVARVLHAPSNLLAKQACDGVENHLVDVIRRLHPRQQVGQAGGQVGETQRKVN
jgi:hypothetical protein